MRTKVLILGAPPHAFMGPWVDLPEGGQWEVEPREDYLGQVCVEVDSPVGPRYKLNTQPVIIEGQRARAMILVGAKDLEVSHITVQMRQVV